MTTLTFISKLLSSRRVGIYLNENHSQIIENRSNWIYKKIRPNYIFIHTYLYKTSIRNFFNRKNSIYHESIYFFVNLFFKLDENKKCEILKILLKILRIKKLYILDDIRHISPFISACKSLKIDCILYMHGQIFDDHKKILNLNPSKYLVWSNFYSNICHKIAPKSETKIINIGYRINTFKNFKKRTSRLISNILFLIEDDPSSIENISYLSKILIKNGYKCFVKSKNKKISSSFSKSVKVLYEKNIFQTLSHNDIDLVLGISSNALFECYLLDILSLSIGRKNQLLYNFHRKYDICLSLKNQNDLLTKLIDINNNYYDLLKYYKQRLWN